MQQLMDEHKYKEEPIFMKVKTLFDKFAQALFMYQTKNYS